MSAPVIRPATATDIPAIRALLEETWHATYDHLLGRDKVTDITRRWHAEEVLASEIGRSGQVFLVADVDGRIAGTASAKATGKTTGKGEVDLNRLYILPHYQGRGLGKALLAGTLAAFPAARAVSLEVHPNNAPAIAFYARAGFAELSRGNACGGDITAGVAHMVMRKTLPR